MIETAKLWEELSKVWMTLSRVWLAIAFVSLLFTIHMGLHIFGGTP